MTKGKMKNTENIFDFDLNALWNSYSTDNIKYNDVEFIREQYIQDCLRIANQLNEEPDGS